MIRKRTPRRKTFNLEMLETRQLLSTAVDQPVTQPSPVETLPADLVPIPPPPTPDYTMPIAGEAISPLADLPPAPTSTTPPPGTLPTVPDCPTNLPTTDPVSGDSLPAGTANNPFDTNTAATGTPAPVVTSTPAPTAPTVTITPESTQSFPAPPGSQWDPVANKIIYHPELPAGAPARYDPNWSPGMNIWTPDSGPDMPINPSDIPPTDAPPPPPIMPEVPGAATSETVPPATITGVVPTTGSSVGDAAISAAVSTVLPPVTDAATGVLAAGIVVSSLTGCNDVVPVPVDPNGVPIPAPPSSATNPPAGQTLPSSSTPVPTTSTPPPPSPAPVAVPSYTYNPYYGGMAAQWPE